MQTMSLGRQRSENNEVACVGLSTFRLLSMTFALTIQEPVSSVLNSRRLLDFVGLGVLTLSNTEQ